MGTIPAWAALTLALIAGAGLPALYLKLRRPRVVDPGAVDAATIAGLAAAFTKALRLAAASGRTGRHGYDTLEVFADGVRAGAHERRGDPVHVDPAVDGRLSAITPADTHHEDGWYSRTERSPR